METPAIKEKNVCVDLLLAFLHQFCLKTNFSFIEVVLHSYITFKHPAKNRIANSNERKVYSC